MRASWTAVWMTAALAMPSVPGAAAEDPVRAAREEVPVFLSSQAAPLELGGAVPSLRFLNSNRIFLLSRLAANGGPGAPDPRLAFWLDEEMLAAASELGAAASPLPGGALGEAAEVPELAALASALDSLAARVAAGEARLGRIRDDFTYHRVTELLIALSAPAAVAARIDSVRLRWNGYVVAEARLDAAEQAALGAGACRPLHRAFARPEAQELELELGMADGTARRGRAAVTLAPDRLTVVVLEVEGAAVSSRAWTP